MKELTNLEGLRMQLNRKLWGKPTEDIAPACWVATENSLWLEDAWKQRWRLQCLRGCQFRQARRTRRSCSCACLNIDFSCYYIYSRSNTSDS